VYSQIVPEAPTRCRSTAWPAKNRVISSRFLRVVFHHPCAISQSRRGVRHFQKKLCANYRGRVPLRIVPPGGGADQQPHRVSPGKAGFLKGTQPTDRETAYGRERLRIPGERAVLFPELRRMQRHAASRGDGRVLITEESRRRNRAARVRHQDAVPRRGVITNSLKGNPPQQSTRPCASSILTCRACRLPTGCTLAELESFGRAATSRGSCAMTVQLCAPARHIPTLHGRKTAQSSLVTGTCGCASGIRRVINFLNCKEIWWGEVSPSLRPLAMAAVSFATPSWVAGTTCCRFFHPLGAPRRLK